MPQWNFADVWEAIARAVPNRPAQIQGERRLSWRDFSRRADALGRYLLAAGLAHQSKVAAYLYNGPEYLETYFAAFKAGLAPVNTNYRYGPEELIYLFDNADAEAIVFHASFTPMVEKIRGRLPQVRAWIAVAEEGFPTPAWAGDYETIVGEPGARCVAPWGRSGDDLLLLYTGGTTGMPKGVMWRQDDLFNVIGAGQHLVREIPPLSSVAEAGTRLTPDDVPIQQLIACPLMHGTGQFSGLICLNLGGSVGTLPGRSFDPALFWSEVERLKATALVIVGPAFAIPMLETLDANPGRWDLSSVETMSSSGAMWSYENKQGLLRHLPPGALLLDSFGSSEAVGMGASASAAGQEAGTAKFMLGPTVAVFAEDGRRVEPGSGERGLVAVSGFLPVGYYKDPEKSARTFRTLEGVRWSIPGDWAEVQVDGSLTLLGRGSQVVNTGGEKVFPEEVEEALKRHPDVRDAVVVGIPDPRFGERICAVVDAGEARPGLDELAACVKEQLAAYKAPRALVLTRIERAANGKVDYKAMRDLALKELATTPA